jgi:hypothetical protein
MIVPPSRRTEPPAVTPIPTFIYTNLYVYALQTTSLRKNKRRCRAGQSTPRARYPIFPHA